MLITLYYRPARRGFQFLYRFDANNTCGSGLEPGSTQLLRTVLKRDWTYPAKEAPKPRIAVHRRAVIAHHEYPLCDQDTLRAQLNKSERSRTSVR